ncbi:hypothetical protein KJ781_02490, partial [Patescibacteria group bacterium]|nr:hypothetical protein [Patescibacteria group bacterium]MBU1448385.1 hypothetical protein [Patescibacteria group bacterium]
MSTVRLRKPPVATFVVVALVLVLGGGFFFAKSAGWLGRAPAARPAPVMTPDEITELVNRLSQQIPVPAGESPTVATIEDIDTLRSQNPEFYKEAENGDRLLVWSNTAILYSSKLEKVLNVLSIQ